MSWQGRRHNNYVGAIILIAIGIIGLVSNFDLVPRELIENLWKFWPVIPLVIGISIFARPRYTNDRPPV